MKPTIMKTVSLKIGLIALAFMAFVACDNKNTADDADGTNDSTQVEQNDENATQQQAQPQEETKKADPQKTIEGGTVVEDESKKDKAPRESKLEGDEVKNDKVDGVISRGDKVEDDRTLLDKSKKKKQ